MTKTGLPKVRGPKPNLRRQQLNAMAPAELVEHIDATLAAAVALQPSDVAEVVVVIRNRRGDHYAKSQQIERRR